MGSWVKWIVLEEEYDLDEEYNKSDYIIWYKLSNEVLE